MRQPIRLVILGILGQGSSGIGYTAFGRRQGIGVPIADFAGAADADAAAPTKPFSLPHDTAPRSHRLAECVADVVLPPACAHARSSAGAAAGAGAAGGRAAAAYEVMPADYASVDSLADAPPSLYRRCDVDTVGRPTHAIAHRVHSLADLVDGPSSKSGPGKGAVSRWSRENLPTALVTFCIPDGMVVDATVAGPASRRGLAAMRAADVAAKAEQSMAPKAVLFTQQKLWNINLDGFRDWLSPRAEQRGGKPVEFVDVPGMGVQLSSWTGWMFNHFSLDTLIRLGLVYDKLTGTDPLWGQAKVVVSLGMKGIEGTPSDLQKTIQWIFDKLGLTKRLAGNTAWLAKATKTQRFQYLVFPDVHPLYHCGEGQGSRTKDPLFLRGTLLPVQRALGVLDADAPRDLVVWAGRTGRRALDPARKAQMLAGVRALLRKHGLDKDRGGSGLAVFDWHHEGSVQHDFEVFRRAWIVIGPHGGQLWNFAFAKPGTLMVEFTTWHDTFVAEDCRTCGFSLANAAGHEYAIVDTPDWNNYSGEKLKPATSDLLSLVDGFLGRNKASIVQSPKGKPAPAPPCVAVGGERGRQCHYNFEQKEGVNSVSAADVCRRHCAAQTGCAEWSVSKKLGCRIAKNADGCCLKVAPDVENCNAGHGWHKEGCADNSCAFFCGDPA